MVYPRPLANYNFPATSTCNVYGFTATECRDADYQYLLDA